MININRRILHEIVHPTAEDYEICYMVIMFVEYGKIVQVATVELKNNFATFEGSTANIYYAYSSN